MALTWESRAWDIGNMGVALFALGSEYFLSGTFYNRHFYN